jgi:hypothetical protein
MAKILMDHKYDSKCKTRTHQKNAALERRRIWQSTLYLKYETSKEMIYFV